MLKKQSDAAPIRPTQSDIRLRDSDLNPGQIAKMISGVEVRPGFPEHVLELNDVFIIPGASNRCLYDNKGHRVVESCVRRGRNGHEFFDSENEIIEIPFDYKLITEPLVYHTAYFSHWGHFLTESISRLWAKYVYPELKCIRTCVIESRNTFTNTINTTEFFSALSISPLDELKINVATRIEKCFVPMPSFAIRFAAYTGHLTSAHDVAETMLRGVPIEHKSQPAYLSRSKLNDQNKSIRNEIEFENLLRKQGIDIIHPQELTLKEQIVLVNTRNTLIGCVGSALHNLIFALDGRNVTAHVFSQQRLNKNYLMMDAIVGNSSHYVPALSHGVDSEVTGADAKLSIDVDMAVDHLRTEGII
jgi:capsular polysaccharide biosynthesis protein